MPGLLQYILLLTADLMQNEPIFCHAGEGGSGDSRRDHGGRGHKKPRLVWTAELHARFMNAVTHLVRLCSSLPSRAHFLRAFFCFVLKYSDFWC